MADRLAEVGDDFAAGVAGTDGEQGDFVIEVDEAFNDDAALIDPAATCCVIPGFLHVAIKFREVVENATGKVVEIPESVKYLLGKEKQSIPINPDFQSFKDFLMEGKFS